MMVQGSSKIHLMKVCVGIDSIEALFQRQGQIYQRRKQEERKPYLYHITRHRPKRIEEILEKQGSLYWRIKGYLQLRQQIINVDSVLIGDQKKCRLWLDDKLVAVNHKVVSAFQGWRYLTKAQAPEDLSMDALMLTEQNMDMDSINFFPHALKQKLLNLGLW